MGNPFIHVELQTQNLAKANDFYGKLFDWQLESIPEMEYTMINVGGGTGGGMWESEEGRSQWLPYVVVDDIKASTEKARALGATIHKEVMEVPGAGWMSVIADPTGAALGLWQPMRRSS